MHSNYKDSWLEALRSGYYQQCRAQLCQIASPTGESYCCLGVLADLVAPKRWVEISINSMGFLYLDNNGEAFDYCEGELPEDILEKVGLTKNEQQALINLNDGMRVTTFGVNPTRRFMPGKHPQTFAQIADYIEENL